VHLDQARRSGIDVSARDLKDVGGGHELLRPRLAVQLIDVALRLGRPRACVGACDLPAEATGAREHRVGRHRKALEPEARLQHLDV